MQTPRPAPSDSIGEGDTITGRLAKQRKAHARCPGVATGIGVPEWVMTRIRLQSKPDDPRDVTIGKTVDSSDDMARLMLVTHYAGSKSVKVYAIRTTTWPV